MDFVAIDFETANEVRSSACSIGIALVQDNKITETKHFLIRPPELRFNEFNSRLHGITEKHVKDQPEFHELWPLIKVNFENKTLVAHNASFDMYVLKDLLDTYKLPYPEAMYCCSVNIARKMWPDLTNHKLNTVAEHFGLKFNHHDAAEDAKICAHIMIKACQEAGVTSVNDLFKALGIRRKRLGTNQAETSEMARKPRQKLVSQSEVRPEIEARSLGNNKKSQGKSLKDRFVDYVISAIIKK